MEFVFTSSYFQSVCVFRSEVVSYRQHIYGSSFYIHSATLCLLTRAFSPFRFIVIIDRYALIVILCLVLGCFCSSFLFLYYFALFSCDLIIIFIVMFGFLSLFCVCIYYRFNICITDIYILKLTISLVRTHIDYPAFYLPHHI